jgi:GNAT superfamily N-acetyltransferase
MGQTDSELEVFCGLMHTTIRLLNHSDDLHALTQMLHRAYAALDALGLNYTAVDQTVETTAKRNAQGQCFVAEIGGKVVGTIVYTARMNPCVCEEFTRMASIHQFAVDPPFQGSGVGKALLAHCEQLAQNAGEAQLALDTAEPATHLVQTYTRWGYQRIGLVQWPGKRYRSLIMAKQFEKTAHAI